MISQCSINSYKSLVDESDVLNIRINGLKRERELLIKKMKRGPGEINAIDYSGMPRGSQEQKDIIRYIEDIQRIDNLIYIDEELLDIKYETIKEIENKVKSFHGIEHKVVVLIMKGKTLKEIAEDLGYSYDWVRKINAKIQKAH